MAKFYDFWGAKSELTDVFDAARIPHAVKRIVDANDNRFFYVIPHMNKRSDLFALWFLFCRNGVFLKPHKSYHYDGFVLRCRDRGQRFMRDVCEINRDPQKYREWLIKHNKEQGK